MFFDLPTQWKSSLCCFHVGVNQENQEAGGVKNSLV